VAAAPLGPPTAPAGGTAAPRGPRRAPPAPAGSDPRATAGAAVDEPPPARPRVDVAEAEAQLWFG